MSKKLFLSGLVLFVLLSSSFVSVGFSLVLWTKTYGGVGDQSATSIIETSDGGYAIFGETSFEHHLSDWLLIKIDADGILQWNQTYARVNAEGKDDASSAASFVQTIDGGYALFGSSSFGDTNDNDYWLVKTDEQGNMEWNYTYGGPQFDLASSLIQTSDGGYALFGTIAGHNEDYYIVKTDSQGNYMWSKIYGTGEREFGVSMVEISDGGYALAGYVQSVRNGTAAYQLLEIDSVGNMEWNQSYGWNTLTNIKYSFTLNDLVKTSDEGFALGGTRRITPPFYPEEFFLVKTDEFGNMQWNRTYNEGGGPLIQTFDGGFAYASSYRTNIEETYLDAYMIKIDLNGNVEFNHNHSQVDRQQVSSLIQTSDGGFALAGRTADDEDENSEFWVLKTDEQGIPEFPSWIIPPFFIVVTLIGFLVRKRLVRT